MLVRLIVSKFKKNHSQLSYYSLEIVYAVKDCDPCGVLLYIFLYNLYEGQTLHTRPPQKINFGKNHQTRLRFEFTTGADKT